MKTGRSLQDWAKEIERRANAKRDFMVDTRSMEMFNGEQGPQVSLELQDSRLQLGMTENAHRQIGTHLNIPAKYYELMRKTLQKCQVTATEKSTNPAGFGWRAKSERN